MQRNVKFLIVVSLIIIACFGATSAQNIRNSPPSDEEIKAQEQLLLEMYRLKAQEIESKIKMLEGRVQERSVPDSTENNADTAEKVDNSVDGQVSGAKTVDVVFSASTPVDESAPKAPASPFLKSANDRSSSQPSALQTTDTSGRCEKATTLDRDSYGRFEKAICSIASNVLKQRDNEFGILPNKTALMIIVASKMQKEPTDGTAADSTEAQQRAFFLDGEKKRTDKQIGATPGSSGTTSLVVKGGMPAILSSAVENGSTTSSISGTTVTFRINPLGFTKAAFQRQNLFEIGKFNAQEKDVIAEQLKRISLGFSFDTSRGRENPALVISKQQLSAFSFRYEFINHRNPLSSRYEEDRKAFFASQQDNFAALTTSVASLMADDQFSVPLLQDMVEKIRLDIGKLDLSSGNNSTNVDNVAAAIENAVNGVDWSVVAKDQRVIASTAKFYQGASNYAVARNALLDKINKGTIVSFEYTNHREVNKPDTSNFRFIAEKGTIGNIDLTFNASLTMFNKKPTGVGIKQIKDFDFALDASVPLENYIKIPSTLSFAGKYMRQSSNAVDETGLVMPNTTGDIAFGQIKFTLPIRNTGINIPVSFSFANRSNLIKERFSTGNFGITFDLDKIFLPFDLLK